MVFAKSFDNAVKESLKTKQDQRHFKQDVYLSDIGYHLINKRINQNKSQGSLAHQLRIPTMSLIRIENGNGEVVLKQDLDKAIQYLKK